MEGGRNMSEIYDLVVIGSGPGGHIAAINAAKFGMKVVIIEKDVLGGFFGIYAFVSLCPRLSDPATKILISVLTRWDSISSPGFRCEGLSLLRPPDRSIP